MIFDMGLIKLMTVSVQHEGCWTSVLEDIDAITLNYQVYPEKDYLRSRLLLPSQGKEVALRMKRLPGILRINKVSIHEDQVLVDFLNKYRDSLAGYLYDKEVLFVNNRIGKGMETWSFALPRDSVNEVLKGFSEFGRVMNYTVEEFKPKVSPRLTPSENRVLRAALAHGYLDYPRRADAEEVASLLGLSKVTFLHHLRNAYRKLTEFYLSD
ncbi:putative DNA binding protein [Metallosphaera yellowstonensis MK1]|jgi:predicted DNA binding protein|uniref:Putative DNA binding protein n=2 Tax=Metallosphaera TaxID=41980 RepID=H2C8L5_9CREN|nr:putative DNA binding protein [Metallosphaera yellowstonensis MK1]